MNRDKLPELLSPAGSKDAFLAAVDGGADAIYCGGTSFNARINAKNFSDEELSECIKLAHAYGTKVYLTLNTLLFDKEKEGILSSAESAVRMGIDAFIVADLGVASLIKSHIAEVELHASTQMSVHNAEAGELLRSWGFSRLVPARELSLSDIKDLVDNNPLEVEIFTHGALCVSHSGQCLFSSIVGGRSGNRGLCAQPCRLPYSCSGKKGSVEYPLSLKDLSLSTHVTDILECGAHSLKIEGRMKSPEYVRTVTSVWRTLLDEKRNATPEELKKLSDIFSRGGFTDGYFTKNINKTMLGVRSQADKIASLEGEKFNKITRKMPIDMAVNIKPDAPSSLSVSYGNMTVTALGDTPMAAINAPIDEACVSRCMSKLGDTPFELKHLEIDLDGGLIMPVSRLNDLRRQAISMLSDRLSQKDIPDFTCISPTVSKSKRKEQNTAVFLFPSQISENAKNYFDKTFLPLERYDGTADGFIMPPVVFKSETQRVKELISHAISMGAACAMVGNIGNISFLRDSGLEIYGDFRFNVTNSYTVSRLEEMGVSNITLSPELSLPQIRDIKGDVASIVYGRLPLMTLEKCIIRDNYGCDECNRYMKCRGDGESPPHLTLRDRKGITFPVIREFQHRNIIYNSLPTCMSDKQKELMGAGIVNRVFLFTTETRQEVDRVISAFKKNLPLGDAVRRI